LNQLKELSLYSNQLSCDEIPSSLTSIWSGTKVRCY
jgi:hypothetical protein